MKMLMKCCDYHQIKDFTVTIMKIMTIMIKTMVYSTFSPGLKGIILFKGFQRSWILTKIVIT